MNHLSILILLGLWIIFVPAVYSQTVDISSGGLPTVTGSNSVTVSAASTNTQDLYVSINLGDVSPVNNSNTIKITIPVAIRSIVPYEIRVISNGSFSQNTRAFQSSDVGFGVQNIRLMGSNASQCTQNTNEFRIPFNNNPENNISFNSKGRAKYSSTVSDVGLSGVILSGPRLSLDSGSSVNRNPDNGYIFDAVFVVKPQFYAPGAFSLNFTLSIVEGSNTPC